jgi:glycosyltransferase involved in cell wall biosynthesis
MMPLVSVIMTVYNGQDYLKDSISSILNQSFKDFEFIIVNDGSIDKSDNIVRSFNEPRIKYYDFKENAGVIERLNFAFEKAIGKYIVKMDQDDISEPSRILLQYSFMEKNLDIGVCGSFAKFFGAKKGTWKMPTKNAEIKASLINGSPFCHPSVIFRKSVLVENNIKYTKGYNLTDDFELWIQLSSVTCFANISIALLKYRISEQQVSFKRKIEQDFQINELRKKVITNLINITDNKFDLIFCNSNSKINLDKNEVASILSTFSEIVNANKQHRIYNQNSLKKELGFNLLSAITKNERVWISHVFWAVRNGFFNGLTMRMYFGLLKRLIVK